MRRPVEDRYPRPGDSRLGGAAIAEVDAALGDREGVAMLVHHALTRRRWVLVRAGWRACHGGFVYQVVLARPDHPDREHPDREHPDREHPGLDEVTVIMRLPPQQTSSELVLARTAAAAVTTRPESVRRWFTAAIPPGRPPD
jgi:hypothetical protein